MADDVEKVDHPAHYGGRDNPYEVIKVLEAWGLDSDHCLASCVEYIGRHRRKGDPLTDLRKARWWLDRRIQGMEREIRSPLATKSQQNLGSASAGQSPTPLTKTADLGSMREHQRPIFDVWYTVNKQDPRIGERIQFRGVWYRYSAVSDGTGFWVMEPELAKMVGADRAVT